MGKIRRFLNWIRLKYDPLYFCKKDFRRYFKREINLVRPRNLVEKYFWLELNTDLSLMSLCADKYRVREFVTNRGCGDTLNELYGKWDSADCIDWDRLPPNFILKVNHGSGDVIIVNDKSQINKKEISEYLDSLLKRKYGQINAQYHYTLIKPCIIAEKLLHNDCQFSSSLIDYKIWCFNGEPKYIWVAYDRKRNSLKMDLFNLGWESLPQYLVSSNHYFYDPSNKIPKPQNLDQMLDVASKLSKGFPEVRVDLYSVSNKVYFGELTFTSGYGYFTDEFYNHLGALTKLPTQK